MSDKKTNKSENINIRCTPDEKKAICELAKLAGVTVSGLVLGEFLGNKLGDKILENSSKK